MRNLTLSALLLLSSACILFDNSKDPLSGSGPEAMDPYLGRASDAVRLSLQMLNGCGFLPNGQPTGQGSATFYSYPANCSDVTLKSTSSTGRAPLSVMVDTPYFLDQITVIEAINQAHTDMTRLDQPVSWYQTQTRFKHLDWSGVAIAADEWTPGGGASFVGGYTRSVRFGGAAWMLSKGDTFTLDILDGSGKVVASRVYQRDLFLRENPILNHVLFNWTVGTIGRPLYPGDNVVHTTGPTGNSLGTPTYRTLARFETVGNMDPYDTTFVIPKSATGDGAARVTWSQLPAEPFYFPITFKDRTAADFPKSCFSAKDPTQAVACDFGADSDATLSAPKNGKFYVPGEKFEIHLQLKDGSGNLVHPPGALPTYNDFLANNTNGILYSLTGIQQLGERNTASMLATAGPLDALRIDYDAGEGGVAAFNGVQSRFPNIAAASNAVEGSRDLAGSTVYPMQVPQNARPGTYLALVKHNRAFMGERATRTIPNYYQVGQAEPTTYPLVIGNCQICHRAANCLVNIAMGLDVGAVEACKVCHGSATARTVHQIHMSSLKYPQPKFECTVCHLTRTPPLRASLYVCTACHAQPHGTTYYDLSFAPVSVPVDPSPLARCASTCHEMTAPSQHLLPLQ